MDQNLDRIKAIALDIDGVMTDGSVIPLADGDLLRVLDAKDALAIRVAGMKGYIVAIMSGGDTKALRKRMEDMNIRPENIFLGCRGKLAIFERFCAQNGLSPEEVMYIGDDLPDVPVLRAAGLGIAPADAAQNRLQLPASRFPKGSGLIIVGIWLSLYFTGWFADQPK